MEKPHKIKTTEKKAVARMMYEVGVVAEAEVEVG